MERQYWKPLDGKEFSSSELSQLKTQYDEAVYAYYQTENTIMSDMEFDELKAVLEDYGFDVSSESMVEDANTHLKLTEDNNMLSLSKVQVFSEHFEPSHLDGIRNWLHQYRDFGNDCNIKVGWKLDGCASSLRYDANGNLYDVVTRGNFSIAKKFLEVAVKQHPYGKPNSEIRCEMIMRKSTFVERGYDGQYANPRNLVAGIVNDINVEDCRKWDIDFVQCNDGLNANENEYNGNEYVVNHILQYESCQLHDLPYVYEKMREMRVSFGYPTDGLVVYLTHVEEFRHIGKYPLHAIAVKFPPTEAITTVKEIQWNLKKSGEWIPKAILEPVEIDGSTVQKTLVFNYGFVVEHKVFPGAKVVIAKNGDIIPYIQRVVEGGKEDLFIHPQGTIVGIHLYDSSNAGVIRRERFNAGCYTLGIKNFGYAWFCGLSELCSNDITQLFDKELVNERSLKELFGGDKKVRDFVMELNKITELSMYQLLRLLQIPGMGDVTAMQIARYYSDISYSFSGLEKALVDSCINGEYAEYIKTSKDNVEQFGVHVANLEEPNVQSSITYEMTGSPKAYGFVTKAEFMKNVPTWRHTKLEKTTTYLITDDLTSSSSKMNKAKKYGIEIITYEQAVEKYKTK